MSMRCASCQHLNPPNSRFCNQCGTRLAPASPVRRPVDRDAFALPGTALGKLVKVEPILYGTTTAANAAMAAIGAMIQPELQQVLEVPGLGVIVRSYAVLGNNLHSEEVTDAGAQIDILAFAAQDQARLTQVMRSIDRRCRRALRGPDNGRVVEKLRSGRIKFMPMNRQVARRIEQDLAPVGMHLPWSVGGIDVAFGRRCREVLKGFGFVNYFGHLGRVEAFEGVPVFRQTRHVSVPFGVTGYHTWDAAISDDIVDEDCGLLIEADSWPE